MPGGHVEAGETLIGALKREMREELGIRVEKTEPVHVRYHTGSNGERQRIHYFHVMDWEGRIVSIEVARVYWESKTKS